jgi:hypothetical protein
VSAPEKARLHPITRERYGRAHTWASLHREDLARLSCAPRVLLVVAVLMEDDDGMVGGPVLFLALRTKRVVAVAIELLEEIGAPCVHRDPLGG